MTGRILYDLPAADYHAMQALSAGGAWTLATECPALYWHRSPFNPAAAAPENGKRMDIGTALHLAALEPDRLAQRTVMIEADDWRTKEARDQRDAAYDAGQVPLLIKDAALVDRLADAIRCNKHAAELLDGALTEVSYFWTAAGIPCKARADIQRNDGRMGDLKASASASPEFFQRQAFRAGHFLRVPWYCDGYEVAYGKRISEYWFIVASSEEPHLVTTCRLDDRAIEWGRLKIRRAMALFRECRSRGIWPPYCPEPVTIGLPDWAEYRLADQEQAGHFSEDDIRRGIEFLAPIKEKINA